MSMTFEEYVRSGHLQENFDVAVEKAARRAQEFGLRPSAKERAANDTEITPVKVREKSCSLSR